MPDADAAVMTVRDGLEAKLATFPEAPTIAELSASLGWPPMQVLAVVLAAELETMLWSAAGMVLVIPGGGDSCRTIMDASTDQLRRLLTDDAINTWRVAVEILEDDGVDGTT